MTARRPRRRDRLARLGAAIAGGYGFAWGVAAFGARLGVLTGLAPAEAVALSALVALPLVPAAALWAFAVAEPARAWLVLAGGGLLLTGSAAGLVPAP